MLTRRSSLALLPVLAGAAVAAVPGGASAAPLCLPNACAHSRVTIPGGEGGSGGGSGGGGGGGGDTGPGLGCPLVGGQLDCAPGGDDPAPAPHIPTIDVAYDARDRLVLPSPSIATAPSPRSYIRITTGLWVTGNDIANKTADAQVPGQHVVVTASQPVVTWAMGDGGTITCTGATAATAGDTDCGYTYQRSSAGQADGKYTITATISWNVTWTCAGAQCDTAGGVFGRMNGVPGNLALAVGEVQTQSQPG